MNRLHRLLRPPNSPQKRGSNSPEALEGGSFHRKNNTKIDKFCSGVIVFRDNFVTQGKCSNKFSLNETVNVCVMLRFRSICLLLLYRPKPRHSTMSETTQ